MWKYSIVLKRKVLDLYGVENGVLCQTQQIQYSSDR